MNRRLRRELLLPILGMFLVIMLLSLLPFPLGSLLLICSSLLVFPLVTMILVVIALTKELQQADWPGRYSTGAAVAMIFLYAFLAVGLTAVCLWRYTAIAIHV
jgi:hypothetical protein